jgi:hypothetical protein
MERAPQKNAFFIVRDPASSIRAMLDELRILEGGGHSIQPDRTAMLKLCLERCLAHKKKGNKA